MYNFAHALELLTLLCAVFAVVLASFSLYKEKADNSLNLIEKASLGITGGHVIASLLLLHAFYHSDFSLVYVSSYSDTTLPTFYKITAFWAGQAGSLLFWALMIALCGAAFQFTEAYKSFTDETKKWYWIFYCGIMAFFSLLLTTWSDPFVMQHPVPADGRGLNPLLQNPGMIIHPPLLFLGYGGFTIPSCLALAQALSKKSNEESRWLDVSRPFIMTAWLFLSAGILLGAWWAYMELGWGGYWAWDPVENASLLPWLVGTAALHTMIIEQRRNKLHRTNIFLIAMTTVTAFFATYLVRGNVVDSVHAFGDGGVRDALFIFVVFSTFIAFFVAFASPKVNKDANLAGLETREGFLVFTAWFLIALTVIILCATIWPVISRLWSEKSVGLDANFYNTVCLPLFTALTAILMICPYIGWNGGIVDKKNFMAVLFSAALSAALFFFMGFTKPLPLLASAVSIGVIVSSVLQMLKQSTRNFRPRFAAHGVHMGLAIIVLGVAFSGPYKIEKDVTLARGQSVELGSYLVTLNELYEGSAPTYDFLEAELVVSRNNKVLGMLSPQKRIYHKFGTMSFSEVGTLPSLGNEIYASVSGLDDNYNAVLRVSSNPLVNWLWIGSTLLCVFPFLALRAIKRREEDE